MSFSNTFFFFRIIRMNIMNERIKLTDFYFFRETDTQKQVEHRQIQGIHKYKMTHMFRVLFIAT
jgi:hypothetical protein